MDFVENKKIKKEEARNKDKVSSARDSNELCGRHYIEVEEEMIKCGFQMVQTIPIYDVKEGLLSKMEMWFLMEKRKKLEKILNRSILIFLEVKSKCLDYINMN